MVASDSQAPTRGPPERLRLASASLHRCLRLIGINTDPSPTQNARETCLKTATDASKCHQFRPQLHVMKLLNVKGHASLAL